MEQLLNLNEIGAKVWLKLNDLPSYQAYLIKNAFQNVSKFDVDKMQTVIEISKGYITLPSRFNNMSLENIEYLKSGRVCFVKKDVSGKTWTVEFKEKEDCSSGYM